MFKRTSTLFLAISVLFFFSCFPKRIPLEERTPAKVLDKLIQQEKKLHSLAALMSFKAKSQKGSISSNLELYWTEPDSFAFYFQSIFGSNAVRGRLIRDSLKIYFADENRYFEGDSLDQEEFLTENPKELLNLAVGKYRLEKEKLISSYPQKDKVVYEFEDEKMVWKLWADIKKARIEKGSFFFKDRKLTYRLNFKSYYESKGLEFPRLIEIVNSSGNEYVKLKFIERKVNYSIPPNKFDLRIPQDGIETDSF